MRSYLTSKPTWLSYYPTADKPTEGVNFGFGVDGMFFYGNADGVAYPIRTNFDYKSEAETTIIYSIVHGYCADHGVCIYNTAYEPEWSWGPHPTRISMNVNCGTPELDGQSSGGEGPIGLTIGNTYTFKIKYVPKNSIVTVDIYDGASVNDTLITTLTLNERLPAGPYRVGFDADQDDSDISRFTFLELSESSENYPLPKYTFRVNLIDYPTIYSQPLPDSIDHIIKNLEDCTVYIQCVDRPLKHGDEFTLYGSKAIRVHEIYIGKEPKVLELVD